MDKQLPTAASLHKLFSQINLNMHIRYYNEHKRLVSSRIVEINEDLADDSLDAERRRDLQISEQVYLNSYHDHMVANCFLMMYSHFEECLGVTCKSFSRAMPEPGRSGLDRFKAHFAGQHDIKLSDGPQWSFVCDCGYARNVLLHVGGNIALADDTKKVQDLIRRNKDCFVDRNSRITPTEQLLVKFSDVIADFTEWLVDQVDRRCSKPHSA